MPTEKSHSTAGERRGKIGVQMASDYRWKGLVCAWKAVGSQGQLLSRVWQSGLNFRMISWEDNVEWIGTGKSEVQEPRWRMAGSLSALLLEPEELSANVDSTTN